MTKEQVIKFIESGSKNLTIISCKYDDGSYLYPKYMVSNLREIPTISQTNSWNETELIDNHRRLYNSTVRYWKEKENVDLPEDVNFEVIYVTEDQDILTY
jgi:hypothetical protein